MEQYFKKHFGIKNIYCLKIIEMIKFDKDKKIWYGVGKIRN